MKCGQWWQNDAIVAGGAAGIVILLAVLAVFVVWVESRR